VDPQGSYRVLLPAQSFPLSLACMTKTQRVA
jgi:hypothetical protein